MLPGGLSLPSYGTQLSFLFEEECCCLTLKKKKVLSQHSEG